MSAYGTFSPYCATPKGLANTRGRCPHPAFATWQGAGKNLTHTLTTERWVASCKKAKPLRGLLRKALTGFQLKSASVSFATPTEMERGQGSDEVVHFTLDLRALESTNTHRRGRWIGFATCPCSLTQ